MKDKVDIKEMPREYYKADTMLRYNPLWAFILGERSVDNYTARKRQVNNEYSSQTTP